MVNLFVRLCLLLITVASTAAFSRWRCQEVIPGFHRALPRHPGLNVQSTISYRFRFDDYTPYSLEPDCQLDWNKLWGQSRCGFLRHHHQDSDRFVWRAHPDHVGGIQLAAYSYDNGDKPFQNPGRLLKVFDTIVWPGDVVSSQMELTLNSTLFSLNGTESLLVEHDNQCLNYQYGYKLGLYFGGNCRSPKRVRVCYQWQ